MKIDPNREEEARKLLHDAVVPQAKQFEGFVGGRWLRALEGEKGLAAIFLSSEKGPRVAVERALRGAAAGRAGGDGVDRCVRGDSGGLEA